MEYKRIQGKSYMIWRVEERDFCYDLHMILQNRIPGLIPLQLEQQENEIGFWYDITGKQDLESYSRIHKLNGSFLEKFFISLQRLIEHMGEYLLTEEGISLDPTMLFIEYARDRVYFCYTPFEKRPFAERLKEFMEYFLQNMEHGNQEDIQVCYEVYERVQMETIGFLDIIGSLQSHHRELGDEDLEQNDLYVEEESKARKERKVFIKKPHWKKKWKSEELPIAFEPGDMVSEEVYPTVFLGSETTELLGELRYEGNGMQKNMKITKSEFLIGKEKSEVDGEVTASTVSRVHAKIYRKDLEYYIEDLNSTNGTYRNGVLLNYKERVKLEKNDSIRFAEETYRFV